MGSCWAGTSKEAYGEIDKVKPFSGKDNISQNPDQLKNNQLVEPLDESVEEVTVTYNFPPEWDAGYQKPGGMKEEYQTSENTNTSISNKSYSQEPKPGRTKEKYQASDMANSTTSKVSFSAPPPTGLSKSQLRDVGTIIFDGNIGQYMYYENGILRGTVEKDEGDKVLSGSVHETEIVQAN